MRPTKKAMRPTPMTGKLAADEFAGADDELGGGGERDVGGSRKTAANRGQHEGGHHGDGADGDAHQDDRVHQGVLMEPTMRILLRIMICSAGACA